MNRYVVDYWMHRGGDFGYRMISSGLLTEQDLLFLMPNNYKKMHGLPMTRANGQRKSIIEKKRRYIWMRPVFAIIEDIIEDLFPQKVEEQFSCFASVSDI